MIYLRRTFCLIPKFNNEGQGHPARVKNLSEVILFVFIY
jgi:hypothetical protein